MSDQILTSTCSWHQITHQALEASLANQQAKIGCAKLFCYYDANGFFIDPHYILNHLHRIQHLPCIIVHGRYDTICKLSVAYDLHQRWQNSKLYIVSCGGHTIKEQAMSKALFNAIKSLKKILNSKFLK